MISFPFFTHCLQEYRHHSCVLRAASHPAGHHISDGNQWETSPAAKQPAKHSRSAFMSGLQVVNVTGNQDICYYNFLCAHPLGALRSLVFFCFFLLCFWTIVTILNTQLGVMNLVCSVHSTTSSVTLVTWCWDSSSSSLSSRGTSHTTERWIATISTRWWDARRQTNLFISTTTGVCNL